MLKFGAALVMLGILAALSWMTLPDPRFRSVVWLVLGGCAVKIWLEHRRRMLEGQGRE